MITSTSNAKVKNVAALMKKAKERNEQGVFLVEGPKMFREIPLERLEGVFVSETFYSQHDADLPDGTEIVADSVFKAMSGTQTPQGVIALVKQFRYTPGDLLKGSVPLMLILEDIQDPGNLGTIFRSAEGAGITGILMSTGCVDVYNPKVIRSTMGSVLRVPFFYTQDLQEHLEMLKKTGLSLYAAHLKGREDYTRPDYTGPTAFLVGNESKGLREETAALCSRYIRIPMAGRVESLNAGVAASLLSYEAARQRGFGADPFGLQI